MSLKIAVRKNVLKSISEHALEFLFPLYYVFSGYIYSGISVGYFILAAMLFLALKRHRERTKKTNIPLILFTLYIMFADILLRPTMMQDISRNYVVTIAFNAMYLLIICYLSKTVIDEDALYRAWRFVGFCAMIGLLYHAVLVYALGQEVTPIRLLPADPTSVWYTHKLLRPMSFFPEPSSYVIFMMPLLYLALKRQRVLFAAAITFTMLLSTSTNGILLAAVIWGVYILTSKLSPLKKVSIVFLFVALAWMLFNLPIFEYALNKLSDDSNKSGYIRVQMGFDIYKQLDWRSQFLGINSSSLAEHIRNNSIWLKFNIMGSDNSMYTNGISSFLIWYGWLGTLFLVAFLANTFFKNKSKRTFVLVVFIAMFAQELFFNPLFVFNILFIVMPIRQKEGVPPPRFS